MKGGRQEDFSREQTLGERFIKPAEGTAAVT